MKSYVICTACILVVMLGTTGCISYTPYYVTSHEIEDNPQVNAITDGVLYSLPKAKVVATVSATYTEIVPGKYYKYGAGLGLNDGALIPKNPNKSSTVPTKAALEVRAVKLTASSVPDRANSFAIHDRARNRVFVRRSSYKLSSDGRIKSNSAEVHEQVSGAAVSVLAAVVEVAKAGIPFVLPELGKINKASPEIALVGGCGADTEQWVQDYCRLRELQSNHKDLFLGSTPPDKFNKDHAVLAREEINAEMKRLLERFSSKKTTKELEFQILLTDEQLRRGSIELAVTFKKSAAKIQIERDGGDIEETRCHSSASDGYRDRGIVYRVPRVVSYRWKGARPADATPSTTPPQSVETTPNASPNPKPKANVEPLQHGGDTYSGYVGTVNLPQFGWCARAPNTFKGRRGMLSVSLDEETGMLVDVTFERSKLFSTEEFQAAGKGVGEVLTSLPKQEGEADPVQDEIDRLTKDLEKRELERKVKCYEDTGAPCPDAREDDEE